MSKKTAAIFTTSEGHASLAQAAADALGKDYKIKIFYEDIPMVKVYMAFYQFMPSLAHLPGKAINFKQSIDTLRRIAQLKYQKKINKFFTNHHPDVMINTYGVFNSCLEDIQHLTKVPLVNIISDPKNPYPVVISPGAKANFAFDQNNIDYCHEFYPDAAYQKSGWLVRKKFEGKYNLKQVRQKLKLDPDTLTFLIASGSEGTNLVLKVLPTLLFAKQPLQVVVACGKNKALYKSVQVLNTLLDKTNKNNLLIPIKFTPDIQQYMQAADLVIGKAGPNMLFETVATRTPFFAITHIAGQEDGNLEIIKDYNLGYVEENIIKAQKLLKNILDNPEQLTKFSKDIEKLKKYNQRAKKRLLKLIDGLIS